MSSGLGPHFHEMSIPGQVFLREWLRLAREFPPGPDEVLPTDFTLALADLARPVRGRQRRGRSSNAGFQRQMVTSNRARKVRASR